MRVLIMLVLAGAGCGPSISEGEVEGTRDAEPVQGELVIPVQAQAQVSSWFSLNGGWEGVPYTAESSMALGWGPAYPTELTLEPGEFWQGRCGWEGTWTPESVSVGEPGVLDARVVDGSVALDVLGEGSAVLQVVGTFRGGCPWRDDPPRRKEITFEYEVDVLAPAGAVLQLPYSCEAEDELVLVAGTPQREETRVRATDADGEVRTLANAREDRQVRLTLDLPPGMSAWPPAPDRGFSGVTFTGQGGAVDAIAPTGLVRTLDVVPVSAVTDMDMHFSLPYGTGRGDLPLYDGLSVSWEQVFTPAERMVVATLGAPVVDGVQACTEPGWDWTTYSVSPDQPPLDPEYVYPAGSIIEDDGPITFTLSAPRADGGRGLQESVTVSFSE